MNKLHNKHLDHQYLANAAPLADFTGSMDSTRQTSLVFAGIIILLAIPIAIYTSQTISKPLNILAREADQIRHLNLDSPIEVTSKISEITDLSKAIQAMKLSLSSFGRYIPMTLVKRMLLAKEDPQLGGQRQEATLLFTDIADFTTISESMPPEELMLNVSDYLQAISSKIHEHDGTIDKYIGDAVMAFWNAPVQQDNHAELACLAALAARDASEDLNNEWQKTGLPVMFTRFGLHTGNPIIGNVGSDDRMNYTAMGASVNLASRLEGLNKYYGTQILVSETVVKSTGDRFLCRPVGKVMPKGTTIPISVFELLGEKDDPRFYDGPVDKIKCISEEWQSAYDAYQERRFMEAATIFERCTQTDPNDNLAASMLDRANYLAEFPPDEDWDGVDVFKTK